MAALRGFARDYDLGALTVGVRGQTAFDFGTGLPLSATRPGRYRRAFGDVVPKRLPGLRDRPVLPVGRRADRPGRGGRGSRPRHCGCAGATLGVAYTGQTGSRAQDQAVKGNFTYRF